MEKLNWVINWQSGDTIEYDLQADRFTLFRLRVRNGIVIGVPVYPAIIDTDWYMSLMHLTLEDVQFEIGLQLNTIKL